MIPSLVRQFEGIGNMAEKKRPTLARASVQISFRTSDGYSSKVGYAARDKSVTGEEVFLGAFEEMARLAHLYGLGARAERVFYDKAHDVAADLSRLTQQDS
jgi:hypothetical protein